MLGQGQIAGEEIEGADERLGAGELRFGVRVGLGAEKAQLLGRRWLGLRHLCDHGGKGEGRKRRRARVFLKKIECVEGVLISNGLTLRILNPKSIEFGRRG